MRYYMRQKVFSWRDKFSIMDEAEQTLYYAESELFTWGKKLHLYDNVGNEMAFIQQKVLSFLPRFYVFQNDVQVAEIVKEFTFFHPRYRIEGPNWQIDGDFWEHDYQLQGINGIVATVSKAWLSWGDCYMIDIAEGADDSMVLAVVLAIDCVMAQEAAAASS